MKKSSLALAVLSMAFLSQSCVPDPVACFEASKVDLSVDEEVSLTDCSEEAESYSWDFGDGNTSTDKSPKHAYEKAGDYTVKLVANSKNDKKSDEKTISLKVVKTPIQMVHGTKADGATAGVWKFQKIEYTYYFESSPTLRQTETRTAETGDNITFRNNLTYTAQFGGPPAETGIWEMNASGDVITMDKGTEDEAAWSIQTLNETTLTITTTEKTTVSGTVFVEEYKSFLIK